MLDAIVAVAALLVGLGAGFLVWGRAAAASARRCAEAETAKAVAESRLEEVTQLKSEIERVRSELTAAATHAPRCEELTKRVDALEGEINDRDAQIRRLTEEVRQGEGRRVALEKTEAKVVELAKNLEAAHELRNALTSELHSKTALLSAASADRDNAQTALVETNERHARAIAEVRAEARREAEERLADKDAELQKRDAFIFELEKKIETTLGTAAHKVVQEAQENFVKISQAKAEDDLDKRRKAIEELVAPLKVQLAQLEEIQKGIGKERSGEVALIREGIASLTSQTMRLENAFRKPQSRGAWGEQQLEILLEHAGMRKDVDFFVQQNTTEEERRLRADFVIDLRNNRKLVIDCKVPLDAYTDGMNSTDELARNDGMRRHAEALDGHIRELASKKYQERHPGADCVILFIPHEGAYIAALDQKPRLIDEGRDRRVYLASPSSILSIIHLARYVLAEARQRDRAAELASECGTLLTRIVKFAEHFSATGKALTSAQRNYNEAVGSFDRMLMPSIRRLDESARNVKTPETASEPIRALSSPELQDGVLPVALELTELS